MFFQSGEEREREAVRLEGEIAEVCGLLNATTARLVTLIAQVLATKSWTGWGIRSPEHWVAWQCESDWVSRVLVGLVSHATSG